MGENVRVEVAPTRVETHFLKTLACGNVFELIESKGSRLSARFKKSRVGAQARNTTVSGFACRPF